MGERAGVMRANLPRTLKLTQQVQLAPHVTQVA